MLMGIKWSQGTLGWFINVKKGNVHSLGDTLFNLVISWHISKFMFVLIRTQKWKTMMAIQCCADLPPSLQRAANVKSEIRQRKVVQSLCIQVTVFLLLIVNRFRCNADRCDSASMRLAVASQRNGWRLSFSPSFTWICMLQMRRNYVNLGTKTRPS